jgi:hypothetical protein
MSSANYLFDEVRASLRLERTSAHNEVPYLISPLQFIGTFILIFVVFAVSDRRNSGLHPSLAPLPVFIVILGIGAGFGMQTGTSRSAYNTLGYTPPSLSSKLMRCAMRRLRCQSRA